MNNVDSVIFYKTDHSQIETAQAALGNSLSENAVTVVYIRNNEVQLPSPETYLSVSEISEMAVLKSEEKLHQYLTSQWLLKNLLSSLLQIPASEISFQKGPLGKPYLSEKQNGLKLDFNISHTKEITLIGFAKEMQIGVDVEKIVERKYSEHLATRFFKPSEVQWITQASDHQEKLKRFFRIWCMKEAVIKTIGGGIFQNIQQISFIEQSNSLQLQSTIEPFENLSRWKTFESTQIEDHACSIALYKNS